MQNANLKFYIKSKNELFDSNNTQKMIDSGKKFCVLYTDTSNKTSNKIYQQVGYEEIAISKHYIFGVKNV